jgi:hypothetical protein|tara:strand:+ start:481 stop:771 length:291 start_codon:yes stop_codon:yes gene_type:complete
MLETALAADIGDVAVSTTNNRGLSPEELAQRATDRIVTVSSEAEPIVRQQAEAFKSRIYHVVLGTINQAIKSDRTTLCGEFVRQGHTDVANILRRL